MRIADALRIRSGDVVTLVGAGGKTTVMFRLADELVAAGLRVLSTMTTKIFVGQMARAPLGLLLGENDALPAGLASALAEHRHVLIGGRIGADREKVEGVPPDVVDRLAAAHIADVIIVEADGSRRLPLKAPAEHEPVIPTRATVVVPLAGVDALSQPLDADHVHRPQLVCALTGAPLGQPITPAILSTVLSHRAGGAKGLPMGARLIPFLNKADSGMAGAREAAQLLLDAPVVTEAVIGAAETPQPVREVWGRVTAVVLAGGEARRFGRLKQVLPWHGVPLVTHVVSQALSCNGVSGIVVTTGAEQESVRAALASHDERVALIHVDNWAEGQSRSVRAGLTAAMAQPAGQLSAVLFLLADQPGVTPQLLMALIQRHRETLAPVVAPRYEGRRGNPVLFNRSTFYEFAALQGDVGARGIIQRHEGEIAWVDWPTDEILRDIDTPQDYDAALHQD